MLRGGFLSLKIPFRQFSGVKDNHLQYYQGKTSYTQCTLLHVLPHSNLVRQSLIPRQQKVPLTVEAHYFY